MTHAITRSFVFTSGAGTSESGPSREMMFDVYRRVSRSSSPTLSTDGSQITPPFEPPNGRFTTAHFHVIHAASAFTSSRLTCMSKRMPPLAGPRDVLYKTRKPVNTSTSPLSMWTGIETVSCFSGLRRIL